MAKITYTDKTTANTSPLPTTQKFTSGDANEIKASVNALYDAAPLVYKALLSQTGTDAPTAVVHVNTLGGVPVFGYDGVGYYRMTLNSAFPQTRAHAYLQNNIGDGAAPAFFSVKVNASGNYVEIATGDGQDGLDEVLANTPITIEIYPT